MKEAVKKTLVVISVLLLIVANVFIFSEKALAENEWVAQCYVQECGYFGDMLCGFAKDAYGNLHPCLEIYVSPDED